MHLASRFLRTLLACLMAVAVLPGRTMADKTLMWLVDWYQIGNVDTITTINSVSIPHFDGTAGYFYGAMDQALTLTKAYAAPIEVNQGYRNDTLPDSLKIPTKLYRNWYSIPNFNTANYQSNRIRIYLSYAGEKHMPMLNRPDPKVQVDVYPKGAGQTDQLEGKFVNGCIDSTYGDTVWFWTGALTAAGIQSNASAASIKCLDHNPFFEKIGTVHVLNPWPGKTVYAQMGNTWYPLYQEPNRSGWLYTTLWADPRSPQQFKIRLANGDPNAGGTVQYWDAGGIGSNATGSFLDYSAAPGKGGEVWILPPFGTATKPAATKAPPVALSLYIKRPAWSASAVRVVEQGLDARFIASATKYCDWFKIDFYQGAVPTKIALTNPMGDTIYAAKGKGKAPTLYSSFTDWIDLTTQVGAGGTFSLNTDANSPVILPGLPATGGLCDTKILAFSAYDYAWPQKTTDAFFYQPFSETGPDDNCPSSGNTATKGLVQAQLTKAGTLLMNNTHKPACGIDTRVPANNPGLWFDSLWRTSAGAVTNVYAAGATPLNAFHCVRVPLKLDAGGQYYTYASTTFWPLDTANVPAPYGKASGMEDRKFAMHAKASFEYVPGLKFEFVGDDDVWIFIDKKLALDVGGQHGPNGGTINVDNLGLVEGKSYQFDMFYTEREGMGSSISIKTTMNLVPVIDVKFDTTASSGKVQVVVSRVTETTNDASKCPEEGATNIVNERPGNPVYNLTFPDGTELMIDSAYVAATMPGVSISQNGSRFEIDTSVLQKSGKLTMSGLYQIRIDLGTESRLVTWSNVSKAVEVIADLFDVDGDGRGDSTWVHTASGAPAFMKPVSLSLNWADRAGNLAVATGTGASLVRQPGDSTLIANMNFADRTNCPPSGCKGKMGTFYTQLFQDTVENPVIELRDRIAPVADSAWLIFDTTGAPGAKDTLYVRVSESIVPFNGLLPKGDSAFVLTGRPSLSRPVPGQAQVVNGGVLLKIALDPQSNPILPRDSIRLGGFSGDANGNAPGLLSKWVPLKADPVAKAYMLDRNGDGAPDQVRIESKGDLSKASQVIVHWKNALGADTSLSVATPSGVGSLVDLPSGLWKNATSCTGCVLEVVSGAAVSKFRLLDSVPAVAISATFRYGRTKDSLVVVASEPVTLGAAPGEGWFGLKAAGDPSKSGKATVPATSLSGTTLVLELDPGSVSGDSLRLRGWAVDAANNAPGLVSPFVPVVYGPQPIRVIVRDRNGDGLADDVQYLLTRSAQGAPVPTSFQLVWGGNSAQAASLTRSADLLSWQGAIGPLPPGTTPMSSDHGTIAVGTDVTSFVAAVEDSVAPVAMSAQLVFGFDPGSADTLKIQASEPLSFAGTDLAILSNDSAGTPVAIAGTLIPCSDKTFLCMTVPSGSIPSSVAWARLGTSVSDGAAFVGTSSRWRRLRVTPSGRAAMYDNDGDGRANFVSVRMRGSLVADQAKVSWSSDTAKSWGVGPKSGNFTMDPADSRLWFPFGITDCQAVGGCFVEFFDQGVSVAKFSLDDSVAPMVVAADYAYGDNGADTLRVQFSEVLKVANPSPAWVEWGGTATSGAVSHDPTAGGLDADQRSATFILRGTDVASPDWEQIRIATGALAGHVTDAHGVAAGLRSPFAPLTFGLPPMVGAVYDPNGLGRGTSVAFWTTRPVSSKSLAKVQSWTLGWAGETRLIASTDLLPAGTRWAGALRDPFALGATACDGCGASLSDGVKSRSVPVLDSVPPSLVRAQFRYSRAEIALDTFILKTSEAWPAQQPGDNITPLISVFSKLGLTDVTPMKSWLQLDGTTFLVVVDTSIDTVISRGDSARLAWNNGSSHVFDVPGNKVGEKSRLVPIEFGLRPVDLVIRQENQMRDMRDSKLGIWSVPPTGTPNVEILVQSGIKRGVFYKLDGSLQVDADGTVVGGTPAVNPPEHVMAVFIQINRPLEGKIFVFDNMGVAVSQLEIGKDIDRLWPAGQEDRQQTIRLTWNGTDGHDHFVSSGVYLMRAVVKFNDKDGNREFRNLLWKYGWNPATTK